MYIRYNRQTEGQEYAHWDVDVFDCHEKDIATGLFLCLEILQLIFSISFFIESTGLDE